VLKLHSEKLTKPQETEPCLHPGQIGDQSAQAVVHMPTNRIEGTDLCFTSCAEVTRPLTPHLAYLVVCVLPIHTCAT
jgi:hypothetical protein